MPVRFVLIRVGWFFVLLLGMAGCRGLSPADLPTPYPTEYLPTLVALTIEAGRIKPQEPDFLLRTVTSTPTDDASLIAPTATLSFMEPAITPTSGQKLPSPTVARRPSVTPSATPGIPSAQVQILDPGPMSVVVSPLYLNSYLHAIPGGSLHIELWREPRICGEEAQPLVRDVQRFNDSPSPWLYITQDLEFEVPGASILGRVQVSTLDEHGRLVALASNDVILLAMGEADINPAGSLLTPLEIQEPAPNKLIQGGTVQVSGEAKVNSDEPLLIELVARDGKVVGYRQAYVPPSSDGGYVSFSVDVPYTVSEATWARVTVQEISGGCIPGVLSVSSVEVLLSP